jgi:hypothetical protein
MANVPTVTESATLEPDTPAKTEQAAVLARASDPGRRFSQRAAAM